MIRTHTEAPSAPAQYVLAEIASQPEMWSRAAEVAAIHAAALPQQQERVAVVGCGTSWFVAQAYAGYREQAGLGETDAFAASEFPAGRRYDLVMAITRSGTTTEVLDLLARLPSEQRTLIVVGDPDSPGARAADHAVLLPFADEKSVAQTRFATTTLSVLRAALGEDLVRVIDDCRAALVRPLPKGWQQKVQFTFLGRGPAVGLAHEAALKMREAAIAWAESYPAQEYRHGPIAVAEKHSLVWILGDAPAGLPAEIKATGAALENSELDPMADLVRVQRLAVEVALHRGYDPDSPRNLRRSIILEP